MWAMVCVVWRYKWHLCEMIEQEVCKNYKKPLMGAETVLFILDVVLKILFDVNGMELILLCDLCTKELFKRCGYVSNIAFIENFSIC